MEKKELLYEGKAKQIFVTDETDLYIMYFKDDATAFDGKKKGTIEEKGVFNNKISSHIFEYLEANGVKTHFVKQLSEREMLTKKLDIIMVEVIIRNIAAGSFSKRMGIEEGTEIAKTIVELSLKSDPLGDPMINDDYVEALELATAEELVHMKAEALKVNDLLSKFFDERGIFLVDFKLEFGRHNGGILLGDEITPDGCRLWDKETHEKLDKDRFRRDLGGVEEAYKKVLDKVLE
ncbi:MAG: phosphoribosylaminoimidazolesuccinocarboxamide synthase [Thermodesulfobacteriota bacterium]